jgi:hypothetical protein
MRAFSLNSKTPQRPFICFNTLFLCSTLERHECKINRYVQIPQHQNQNKTRGTGPLSFPLSCLCGFELVIFAVLILISAHSRKSGREPHKPTGGGESGEHKAEHIISCHFQLSLTSSVLVPTETTLGGLFNRTWDSLGSLLGGQLFRGVATNANSSRLTTAPQHNQEDSDFCFHVSCVL